MTQARERTLRARLPRLLLRLAILLVLLFVIVTFVVVPVGFGIAATSMPREPVGAPPEGFEALTLTTADGVRLAAWYARPQSGAEPGPAVVLVHGASNSREGVRPYAEMLARHGFGVLTYDQRGHGESEGQTNLYGWEGGADVAAAVTFLSGQPEVTTIGGLGLSLGGEVLVGAASANPAMTAIVSEGTAHRSMAEFRAIASHADTVRGLQPWIGYTVVRLITGDDAPIAMQDSIRDSGATRFLLIAAADATDEVEYANTYAEAAPGRAEVWVIPEGGHIGGLRTVPAEYEARVVGWLRGD
ncbi:MAG: alpha/beta fold hydrolase [Chloroflexi bacterium]|nr:alpha/beta fold hydrolase [Chloroflexota bacterium]